MATLGRLGQAATTHRCILIPNILDKTDVSNADISCGRGGGTIGISSDVHSIYMCISSLAKSGLLGIS